MSLIPDPLLGDSNPLGTSATSPSLFMPSGPLPIHFQDPTAFGPELVEGPQLDPNSPELFKSNIHVAQQHVIRIQQLAQNAIAAIERAYTANSNYAMQASGDIISLRHAMDAFTEFLRDSGVGSLPSHPYDPTTLPSETQMIEDMTKSVEELFEKRRRMQENADGVASLLISRENWGRKSFQSPSKEELAAREHKW